MWFHAGFSFRGPAGPRVAAQANGSLHDLVPVHMEPAVFVGSQIYDFGVKRNTNKGLFGNGTTKADADGIGFSLSHWSYFLLNFTLNYLQLETGK
jgi:hypothetical protein